MNLYVASAFSNRTEVKQVQTALTADGHTLSHDWTDESADHLPPGAERDAYLEQCGKRDLEGIYQADAVIVIAHPDMKDTRAELGYALGIGCPVYVLNAERAHSVFYGRTIRVDSLDDLIQRLRNPA